MGLDKKNEIFDLIPKNESIGLDVLFSDISIPSWEELKNRSINSKRSNNTSHSFNSNNSINPNLTTLSSLSSLSTQTINEPKALYSSNTNNNNMSKKECPKCGYKWEPLKENPLSCPRCKRRFDYPSEVEDDDKAKASD